MYHCHKENKSGAHYLYLFKTVLKVIKKEVCRGGGEEDLCSIFNNKDFKKSKKEGLATVEGK